MTEHWKTPKENDRGTIDEIKAEAVDESAPIDPDLGHKPFLSWIQIKDEYGRESWVAYGKDGTEYKLEVDEPPPVKKQFKVKVTPPVIIDGEIQVKKKP